jgi:signal transduction histidine kinase
VDGRKCSSILRKRSLSSLYLEEAGWVRVEVQDRGPGLSAEDQKKLFGKFARLSAKPTGGEHSTGLGLSIMKKMVEAMTAGSRARASSVKEQRSL